MSAAEDLRKGQQQKVERARFGGGNPLHVTRDNSAGIDANTNSAFVDSDNSATVDSDRNLYLQDPTRQPQTPPPAKRNRAAGKLEKPFKDPDYGDPEKGKFDIQQGDFIEFLMKDVVLASAAWAGDKVCGLGGLAAYRILAWGCNEIGGGGKYVSNNAREKWEDLTREREKINQTMQQNRVPESEFGFSPNDDRTTRLSKQLLQIDSKNKEQNPVIDNSKQLYAIAAAAIDGKLDEIEITEKDAPLSKDSQIYKLITTLAANVKIAEQGENFDKEQAKATVAETILNHATLFSMKNHIANNYAFAKMMQLQSKDVDAFEGKDLNKNFQLYLEEGHKLALKKQKKINDGTSEYKDFKEVLETSQKAFKEARANIKSGNYDEKGHNPSTPVLDKLDRTLYGIPKEKNREQLMSEAVNTLPTSDKSRQELNDLNSTMEILEQRQRENEKSRNYFENYQPVKKNTDEKNKPSNINPGKDRGGR